MADPLGDLGHPRAGDDRAAELGVTAHDPELLVAQGGGLEEDGVPDSDLAHVVEQAGDAHGLIFFNDTATTEIYTLSLHTLFRSTSTMTICGAISNHGSQADGKRTRVSM